MKPWKLWAGIALVVVLFFGGLGLGYKLFSPSLNKTTVTADVILTALRDRGFLVTQTYVFDEPVTITKSSGSALKDFFLGQTITARGAMEANVGIDLADVSQNDVTISGDAITVMLPAAKLFNVSPVGPIDVKNDRGILKRLLESDTGYNEASAELSKQAAAAATKPELLSRASDQAIQEVRQLLGYVAQGKTITVKAKN
jgi:hypothetical protein